MKKLCSLLQITATDIALQKAKHGFVTSLMEELRLFMAILCNSGCAPLHSHRPYWEPSTGV